MKLTMIINTVIWLKKYDYGNSYDDGNDDGDEDNDEDDDDGDNDSDEYIMWLKNTIIALVWW